MTATDTIRNQADTLRLDAPAKVNLFLEITGTRADGYHTINSLIGVLDVADVVRLTPSESLSIALHGPFAGQAPAGEGRSTVSDALALALRTGYSRIPVTGEGVDDVVGIANLKDLVAHLWGREDSAGPKAPVVEIMREAGYVPDSKPVDELLREMQQRRLHLAVVIDEYGGTAGLVTMEDIVEEIVGEITDEYDDAPQVVEWLGEGRARVPGRMAIAELAELFDTDIDVEELDVGTVGGLLAYALGRVPVAGSTADYAGLRLTAQTPAGRRHRTAVVVVERLQEENAE